MNEPEKTKLVQDCYSYFKSGDLQSLTGLMSEDIQWILPKIENAPFSGKRQGIDQVLEFFAILMDGQDVLEFTPEEFIAQGDKVVALGHNQWRAKESGRQFGGDFAHVFTVQDGKIKEFHEYMDTASAASAYQKITIP